MTEPTENRKVLLRTRTVLEMVDVSSWTLAKWIKNGTVKSTRVDGILLIPASEVDRMVAMANAEPARKR